MDILYCGLVICSMAISKVRAETPTSIAVVTSDKLQTRLRLLRDSPESLVHRLNSEHKGGKSEDIARASVTSHQWVALDFDFRRQEYYVLDRLRSSILVIVDDARVLNRSQVLFPGISPKVAALAYDWLRRTCFWTDPSYQAILSLSIGHLQSGVASTDSLSGLGASAIKSVIGTGLTEPVAIAVDPVRGHLFWADDGFIPSLEMATVDGQNRRVLVRGLIRPVGITLDYDNNTLYWAERLSGLSVINSCWLAEANCVTRRVSTVYQSLLYDLDFHRGFLISSDLSENRLVIYEQASGHTLRQNWFGTTHGICVASLDRQPWPGDNYTPESQSLEVVPDLKPGNISEVGLVFLAAAQTGIFVVHKTFPMNPTQTGLSQLVQEPGISSLAVDVRRHRLFYYSQEKQAIFRLDLQGEIQHLRNSSTTEIVRSWVKSVTDLAVDWSSGYLYWSDNGYQRIMVSSNDGRFVRTVHYESIVNPQGLVIDSRNRHLFWSDISADYPRIERSDLDGSNRLNLVTKHAFYDSPRSMAIDFRRNRLYWSDGPFISQATLNGDVLASFRRDRASKSLLQSIDVMHDYVMWIDDSGGIRAADVDLDFPLQQNNMKSHFSDTVFSKVVYFHESRQSPVMNQCTIKHMEEITSPLKDTDDTLRIKSESRHDDPGVRPQHESRHDDPGERPQHESRHDDPGERPQHESRHDDPGERPQHESRHDDPGERPQHESRHDDPGERPQHESRHDDPGKRPQHESRHNDPGVRPQHESRHNDPGVRPQHESRHNDPGVRPQHESRHDDPGERPQQRDYVTIESPICSQLCLTSRTGPQCACATGYWLKSNGSCLPGVTVSNYFILCDAKTGRLFRQFLLLPDYYALPLADHTHAIDVAIEEGENKIYWLDSRKNMLLAAYINDTHHQVLLTPGHRFRMAKIVLEAPYRLIYILTLEGNVVAMSLDSHSLVYVVKDSSWTVSDLALDSDQRQLYMAASSRHHDPNSTAAATTTGAILRSDLGGANLSQFLVSQGRPQSITVHNGSVIWTDSEIPGIYSVALQSRSCEIISGPDCQRVQILTTLDGDPGPGDLVVLDGVLYFTDKSKQEIQRFPLDKSADVTPLGFPFMNEIAGFSYFGSGKQKHTSSELPACTTTLTEESKQSECLLIHGNGNENGLNSAKHFLAEEAVLHGLCMIWPQANGTVLGGRVNDYVLPGREILVTCDPGYLLAHTMLPSEARQCVRGVWSSVDMCISVLNYTIQGNTRRGYIVFTESSTFVVPRDVTEVDVVCIGGGGGGYDACDRQLRKNTPRAGMGDVSRFGSYLRAYGGQGGTLHEGGRGGQGRSLFGGDGQLSSSCLGGGAAGETRSPRFCHLSHTSCLFCGAGGAMPTCSVCPFRLGGCGGTGSEAGPQPGAADNYGGGATGTFGGGSGGGGGFSRKTVRVSPLEEIEVTVGRGGVPSAKPAGNGVVVVGWGRRLEDMVGKTDMGMQCKPFTYKLNDEDSINFPDRCF